MDDFVPTLQPTLPTDAQAALHRLVAGPGQSEQLQKSGLLHRVRGKLGQLGLGSWNNEGSCESGTRQDQSLYRSE